MSKMRSDRKPPIASARSPLSLRPPSRLQTPPGSLMKSAKSEVRPEYHTISSELQALAKMVESKLGSAKCEKAGLGANPRSLLERGRLYDEYSARRNERLKRKMRGESVDEPKTAYGLGVNMESGKRGDAKKRESLRKSVATAYSMETPRYMLRSMSKKPPLPVDGSLLGKSRGKI